MARLGMKYTMFKSPVGELLLAGTGRALEYVGFPEGKGRLAPQSDWVRCAGCFSEAERQLGEYFAGDRQQFDLELKPHGTAFQLDVLRTLLTIEYGKTCSYADIARRLGRPKAARAVGAANGRNPLPIVIPCHRVLGAKGSLSGFGGGLPAKQALLQLEASVASGGIINGI